MRITVNHSTIYRYDQAVYPEPHIFRFRPRHDAAQSLLWHRLEITPAPAGRSDCLDQDGNVVVEAWFQDPLDVLEVHSSFEVETYRENPFDFMLSRPELRTLPLRHDSPLSEALAPYLSLRGECPGVRELTRSLVEKANGSTMMFLTELNLTLFQTLQHTVRDAGPPLDPDTTLRDGAGTCRDLAVLFCAACRIAGIPARFVSGYEREASFQDQANMHAWAEVYLDGGGWRGYDPSSGLATSTAHVTVAAAADARLAAPISGTFRGAATARMSFQIGMQVTPA